MAAVLQNNDARHRRDGERNLNDEAFVRSWNDPVVALTFEATFPPEATFRVAPFGAQCINPFFNLFHFRAGLFEFQTRTSIFSLHAKICLQKRRQVKLGGDRFSAALEREKRGAK
jgi:hypothetical protein